MARTPKPSALTAFDDNMSDADFLVTLARSLEDRGSRHMRKERRESLGAALRMPKKDWEMLDGIENDDLFLLFKPKGKLTRSSVDYSSLRPLLRQALVAGCAAVETYVGDRVMERWGQAVKSDPPPPRLLDLPMTVGDWLDLERTYQRKGWGLRQIVELEVRQIASPSPGQIGKAMSIIGEKDLWKRVDKKRGTKQGASATDLERIYERRNRIAHQGDRSGQGRAKITHGEVTKDLQTMREIVKVIDVET